MARFGRVVDGVVLEVINEANQASVDAKYHETIAAQFIQDPNNEIEEGWTHDGSVFAAPVPVDNTPTVDMIKQEANRRIAASGHDWMIIRSISDSTAVPQAVLDYAAAVRAASATLEGTLPEDYTDDSHWPTAI
jgi:hypothetical protein